MSDTASARTYTLHIAADHAGYELKNEVKHWLLQESFSVVDHGPQGYDGEDDFPDFIIPAAQAVAAAPTLARGIVFGGSGQGEAMAANRFAAVRATVYYGGSEDILTLSRQHNDANVLSIGARFVSPAEAKRLIWVWLHTNPLPDTKYTRRNCKLGELGVM